MTEQAFIQLCGQLSGNLWLQGLLVTAGTCFLEDVARCGVGVLVASGLVRWWLAFFCMIGGGMISDIALYLIGRYATFFLLRRRWMDIDTLTWVKRYFCHHAVKTILISRFIPGARSFTYSAAGASRYSFFRFFLLLLGASTVQALVFLQLGVFIGNTVLPYLRHPALRAASIILLIGIGFLMYRSMRRHHKGKTLPGLKTTPSPDASDAIL